MVWPSVCTMFCLLFYPLYTHDDDGDDDHDDHDHDNDDDDVVDDDIYDEDIPNDDDGHMFV